MKKIIIFIATIYFSINFVIGVLFYMKELKTFECIVPGEPHGYIGMGTNSFSNPDPEKCTRRGLTLKSTSVIPLFIAVGMPIVIINYYGNKQSY